MGHELIVGEHPVVGWMKTVLEQGMTDYARISEILDAALALNQSIS